MFSIKGLKIKNEMTVKDLYKLDKKHNFDILLSKPCNIDNYHEYEIAAPIVRATSSSKFIIVVNESNIWCCMQILSCLLHNPYISGIEIVVRSRFLKTFIDKINIIMDLVIKMEYSNPIIGINLKTYSNIDQIRTINLCTSTKWIKYIIFEVPPVFDLFKVNTSNIEILVRVHNGIKVLN